MSAWIARCLHGSGRDPESGVTTTHSVLKDLVLPHLRVRGAPPSSVLVGFADGVRSAVGDVVGSDDEDGLAVGLSVGVDVWPGEAVGLGVGDAVELGVAPGLDRTTKGRDVNTSVFLPFWAWPVPLVAVTSKTYRPSGTGAFPLPEATVPSQPMSVMPGLNPYPFKLKTMLSLAMGLPFEPSAFA